MNEFEKYSAYRDKLEDLCAENKLTYSQQLSRYPCTMTIKPVCGMDAQISMLEDDAANYISPDASIIFAFVDGDLTMRTSETFTIDDSLLQKIKSLFKNLYATRTQYFFRDVMERGLRPACIAEAQRGSDKVAPDAADEADFNEFFEEDPDDAED